jgi:hypothetical protein
MRTTTLNYLHVLLFLFSIPLAGIAQLSGTYTINSANPTAGTNYASFGDAKTALASGVSAAVIFNVKEGTYNEQVEFGAVTGASATNTITIQADPTNITEAKLTYSPTSSSSNWVLGFDGASFIIINGLAVENTTTGTYGIVIDFDNLNNDIKLLNNTFYGITYTSNQNTRAIIYNSNSSLDKTDNVEIRGNSFHNGSHAIFWSGASTAKETGNIIVNNTLNNFSQRGIWVEKQNTIRVDSNSVTQTVSKHPSPQGISVKTTDTLQISYNNIVIKGTANAQGMFIRECQASAGSPGEIFNNMIVSSDVSTGTCFGLNFQQNSNFNIYHNSVYVRSGNGTKAAMFMNYNANQIMTGITVKNNIFSANTGYALAIDPKFNSSNVLDFDHNVYYTPFATPIKYIDSTYNTFADYQSNTGNDSNSVFGDPLFVSSTDLHVLGTAANDMGDNTLGITKDIDGDTRPLSPSTTVDAGADEYLPATCFPSTGFTYSNVNVSGATLSWTPDATNATHKVQFDTSGFILGSGTIAATTSGSYTISGLLGNTTYDAYLISYCSATDSTTWTGPITFTTPCANVSSYPYTETFDGNSWVPYTTTANYQSTIDPCWNATPNPSTAGTGVVKWVVNSGSTASSSTGPGAAYGGSGKYLYIETSNGAAWQEAKLFTRNFDLTSMTNPQMVFQLHRYGADIGRFMVFANHNGQRDTLLDVYGPDGSSWKEHVINLSTYVNDTIQLEFEARKATTFTGDIAIDNIVIEEVPACPKVTAVGFGSKTSSSVKLNITGAGHKYNVEYGPTGFVQGTGQQVTLPDSNAVVTGLFAQTEYDFYVQNNCIDSANGLSTWEGPFTTKTLCGGFVAPYSNNWDHLSQQQQDFCWKSHRNGGSSGVAKSNSPGPNYAIQPVSAPSFYRIANSTNPNGVYMISPEFTDLDSNVNQIRFYASQTGGTAPKHLIIGTLENRDSLNTFSLVDTIYPIRNGTMVEYVVALDSVPAGHKHVAFLNDGSVPSIFFGIDDFNYEPIPSCTAPTATSASDITPTSAVLTWNGSGASSWNVEYGVSGFVQGTGTTYIKTTTTDSLTGLAPQTCYDYYVQSNCGSISSPWFGPYTFCTPCAVVVAPYNENFSGSDWVPTTGYPYNSTFDECWVVWPNNISSPNSFKWVVNNGSTVSSSTGPKKGNGGSGKYVYAEASNSGADAFMKTPTIDFSGLTNPTLTFYYHMYGSNMGDLYVRYVHDTIKDTIAVISGQQHTNDSAAWTMHFVDLSAYKQLPGELQFVATRGNGYAGDMAIDDISIDEASCFDPNGLGTTSVGTYTADLSWTGSPAAQEFYVEYGYQGFTQGSGTGTIDTALTNSHQLTGLLSDTCYDYYVASNCGVGVMSAWTGPFTFCTLPTCPKPTNIAVHNISTNDVTFDWTTGGSANWQYMITTGNQPNGTPIYTALDSITVAGLNPATQYRIWVRDSCSATDLSDWAGPKVFTTNCVAYTMPFTEDFNSMTNNNGVVCWDRSGGSKNWNTWVFTSPNNKLARANFYSWSAGNDAKFTSPEIFVHTNAQLKYKWTHKYWSLYPNDSMYVLSRVVGSATWDTVNVHGGPTFDNPSQTTGTVPLGTPIQETFALPASYVNNNVEIQFHAVSGFGYDAFIDDVVVELDPAFLTCFAPDTLSASNIGITTADVAWTSAAVSNYEISYGPSSSVTPANGTKTTSTTNSVSLSALSGGVKYGFYVREICAVGDTSFWSSMGTFRTMCSPMQLPYNEDFDGANFPFQPNGIVSRLDSCWSREGAWPEYRFVIRNNATPTALTGPSGDVDGTGSFVYMEGSDGSAGDSASLITPLIDLSTAANPYLKYHYHFYGADIQSFYVSADSGAGYVNLDTITGQQHTSGTAAWSNTLVDLSAFANSSAVRIKFQGTRNVGVLGDMSFDQISVFDSVATATCVNPTNFVTTSVACDSVSFSWTSDANTVFSTLVWDTTGFDPTLGGNSVTPATSPFGLGGLAPGTSYDVYLIDSCGLGTTPPLLLQFTTATAPLPVIGFTYTQSNTTANNATVDFDATGSIDGQVFLWSTNNGANTQTGTIIQETYAQNGNDTVHLSVMNACGSVDTSFVVNIQGIGIEDNMISRTLKVYPNPNQGKFRVSFELDGLKQVELSLTNAIGQQVYSKGLGKVSGIHSEELDISDLAKGIYVLQVNANGQRSNYRIIVQ